MALLNNAMEIFKILEKTNCRECKELTCLAFAAAVFRGDRRLEECPNIEPSVYEQYEGVSPDRLSMEIEQERAFEILKKKIASVDFASSPNRLDATLSGDKLTIKLLGKDFTVDKGGNVVSDCHVHGWVTIPLLDYVLSCSIKPVLGEWVPFRELKNGAAWAPLFGQRCEKPLKKVADVYTDLFEKMIDIFSAKPADSAFDSDIAVVLHPLPKAPMLICYWKPDDGLESSLNLFFDSTVEDNLNIESIYTLAAGLVMMFEKITVTHG